MDDACRSDDEDRQTRLSDLPGWVVILLMELPRDDEGRVDLKTATTEQLLELAPIMKVYGDIVV